MQKAKDYDVIIIGSGSASSLIDKALEKKLKLAVVDKGPAGGTCLNLGCIPSKMLIGAADRVMEIRVAEKIGIKAEITGIDFKYIMDRMRKETVPMHESIRKSLHEDDRFDFYELEAHFVDDHTLKAGEDTIRADKIFLASGSRPLIPDLKGLKEIDYLTNETILGLDERPKSMIIIGGGYIAAEYAHFFSAMGTEVELVQKSPRLVPNEEPEISEFLKKELEKRMKVHVDLEIESVKQTKDGCILGGSPKSREKKEYMECKGSRLLVAVGRKSNADFLKVENTNIETDNRGYIKVDEKLETTSKGIYAFGDAIGMQMFIHAANREAQIAWHNAWSDEKRTMDNSSVPHAIFSWPQIASVGVGEQAARKEHEVLVGKAEFSSTTKGSAMGKDGFAKAIVDKESMKILGFHIIGPYASILIQEIVNSMANDQDIHSIAKSIHIHPAMTEIIMSALGNLN